MALGCCGRVKGEGKGEGEGEGEGEGIWPWAVAGLAVHPWAWPKLRHGLSLDPVPHGLLGRSYHDRLRLWLALKPWPDFGCTMIRSESL